MITLHDLQYDYLKAVVDDEVRIHNNLLDAYKKQCKGEWHKGLDDGYFFQNLPYHLKQAGKRDELIKLLLDFNWINAKLKATDIYSLIKDYDFIRDGADVRSVQGALQLSAHILAIQKTQIATQLIGRLLGFKAACIKNMLGQASKYSDAVWLRPLTRSLTPPGTGLIRTLEGHTGRVNSVSLTPDGRCAVSVSYDKKLKVWDLESGEIIASFNGDGKMLCCTISRDGHTIVAGEASGRLHFLRLENYK